MRDIKIQALSALPYLQHSVPATQLRGYFWWIRVMYCIILIASTQVSGLAFQEARARASSGPWKNRPLPNSSACNCLSSLPGDEETMVGCFGLCSPSCLCGEGMGGVMRWGAVLLHQELLLPVAVAITFHLSFLLGLFCSPWSLLFHFSALEGVGPHCFLSPPVGWVTQRRWWRYESLACLRALIKKVCLLDKNDFHSFAVPLEGVFYWLVSSS